LEGKRNNAYRLFGIHARQRHGWAYHWMNKQVEEVKFYGIIHLAKAVERQSKLSGSTAIKAFWSCPFCV